jgi:tol-pal system protein YbgF
LRPSLVAVLGLVAGCALRGDVRKVESQVEALQAELARSEAARQADRDSADAVLAAVQRALAAQQRYLEQLRGEVRHDLLVLAQSLVTIQELTGQSQRLLSEQRRRLDEASRRGVPPVDTGGGAGGAGGPAGTDPEQMYELSLQQLRRGSYGTARLGFREFLRVFPGHALSADALYYIGESFAPENPDSAAAVYEQVVKTYPNSPRAPSALYKLGLLAEQRRDVPAARTFYARVVAGYPRSAEANLARDKLQRLGR